MDTVKVGFIGLGGMGQHHLQSLRSIPEARVVAVCDINPELATSVGTEYRARSYTDHHELLDKEELDALYVVIPPFAHTDAELIAARKGIHLFVEKPVALSLDKAREIWQACRSAGIITSVGYTLRYFGYATRLRRFLADRTVAMIVINRWGGMADLPWWRQMNRSGGQLVEQTTHQVDMVRYVTGKEITSVYADYALRVMGDWEYVDIPDVYSVAMRLEDGTPVSLTTSCQMHKGGGDSSMHFLLDGSRIELRGARLRTLPEENPDLDGEHGQEVNVDRAFVDAILQKDPSLVRSPYDDAMKTLAVTLAANESARKGIPVRPSLS
ncbi:MAG: Gfo/Idh/MocA family oxidoreductase [Anaerolineae bacterium]|nr:Gfo/Idh/MocA family oxidoreductase [Anaerolineae bacterium]